MTYAITMNAIPKQNTNTAFTVTGTYTTQLLPSILGYEDGISGYVALPSGNTVSNTLIDITGTYSYVHPGYANVGVYSLRTGLIGRNSAFANVTVVASNTNILIPSTNNSTITAPTANVLIDNTLNTWGITSGKVMINNVTDTTTSNVSKLAIVGNIVWQKNLNGLWWGKTSPISAWLPTLGTTVDPTAVNTGNFTVNGGKIYDPNGVIHIAKGVNVYGWDTSMLNIVSINNSAQPLTTLFPGINHVRVQAGPSNNVGTASAVYSDPSMFLPFVQQLTGYTLNGTTWTKTSNQNIVVEIEDHDSNMMHGPYTGAALTVQTNWYAAMAKYYMGNPYVWFGSQNEMNSSDGTYSNAAIAAMSTSHVAIYNAIRNTGSKAMFQIMAGVGGSNVGTVGANAGYVVSNYATMYNIVWELHCYMTGNTNDPWNAGYYTNASGYVNGGLSAPASGCSGGWGVIGAQTIKSADGIVPVIIGEWGPGGDAGNPGTTEAAPLVATILAAQAQSVGATAWGYYPSGINGGNWNLVNDGYTNTPTLTTWGIQAASVI